MSFPTRPFQEGRLFVDRKYCHLRGVLRAGQTIFFVQHNRGHQCEGHHRQVLQVPVQLLCLRLVREKYVRHCIIHLPFSTRRDLIAYEILRYPSSLRSENLTILMWSAKIVSRRSCTSPVIANPSSTTWLIKTYQSNCAIAMYAIHTFLPPTITNSSTKENTVNVRLSRIRMNSSLIRSRVCVSLARSRINSTLVS